MASVSTARIEDQIAALGFPRSSPQAQARAVDIVTGRFVELGYSPKFQRMVVGGNVVARLPGASEPNRVFVIGAHFDSVSVSPGADDNASGVAGLLEIARVLAGTRPRISLELVAFGLEEGGAAGSQEYVRLSLAAGETIVGMICLDMIGYTCSSLGCQVPLSDVPGCADFEPGGIEVGDFIAIVGNSASASLVEAFASGAGAWVPRLPTVTGVLAGDGACAPYWQRSDHFRFWEAGYPAILVTDTAEYRNPHYHAPTDTLETLDLDFATDVVRAVTAVVAVEIGLNDEAAFQRGDLDGDGLMVVTDLVAALEILFLGGAPPPCAKAVDVNDDGAVDVSDVVYGLIFLFAGGPAPALPFPECGLDTTLDALGCHESPSCD